VAVPVIPFKDAVTVVFFPIPVATALAAPVDEMTAIVESDEAQST
jgi:hypothetical protein